jgi:photosystem II stability/assembly factor-like uncharacterized protein
VSARRTLRLAALPLVLAAAALWCAAAAQPAGAAAWAPVPSPWAAGDFVGDITSFGSTSVAAAGEGGRIYLTGNAGKSWSVTVPPGRQATVFTSVAFTTSGNGAVASGGLLLVTADGGNTWGAPSYTDGSGPASINDLAMRGDSAVAACDGGVILESADGGQTWSRIESPAVSDLTTVAIAGDGTALAGGRGGEVLVRSAGAWTTAAVAAAPVSSVAASSTTAWGDGTPDIFAAAGDAVLGSDDGVLFTPLAGVPDLTGAGTPLLAWAGEPSPRILVAAGAQAGFSIPATADWLSGESGVAEAFRVAAPGGQSVAYVLGEDGRLVRTLSAGAVPATLVPGRSRLVAGQSTKLRTTVFIGARGTLRLRSRPPGGAWQTTRSVTWRAADWGRAVAFDTSPTLTREYRLEFVYGSVATQLTPVATVTVAPKVKTARSGYTLRVGAVFRFSGTVAPGLRGERVQLLTDRGGGWRPVSGQSWVRLQNGRTWASRAFGTPVAETYRLRAYLPATAKHAAAYSRIVKVTIRR